jgi:hypothetical protein
MTKTGVRIPLGTIIVLTADSGSESEYIIDSTQFLRIGTVQPIASAPPIAKFGLSCDLPSTSGGYASCWEIELMLNTASDGFGATTKTSTIHVYHSVGVKGVLYTAEIR